MPVYVVRPKNPPTGKVGDPLPRKRLVNASRRSKVEGLVLQDFEIERVEPAEAHRLGTEENVKLEDA